MDSGDEIDLQTGHVYWRFTRSKLLKVLEKMDSLNEAPGPGHHYVDISGPVKTLVLSRDEYV